MGSASAGGYLSALPPGSGFICYYWVMVLVFWVISPLVSYHPHTSIISLTLVIPSLSWHIFDLCGEPTHLALKTLPVSFHQEVNLLTVLSQTKMIITIFFSIWPWPGFRQNSCADAMSFPASNRCSRIHSELILVTLNSSPLAVTVTVISQKGYFILLRQECGGCYFIAPRLANNTPL